MVGWLDGGCATSAEMPRLLSTAEPTPLSSVWHATVKSIPLTRSSISTLAACSATPVIPLPPPFSALLTPQYSASTAIGTPTPILLSRLYMIAGLLRDSVAALL